MQHCNLDPDFPCPASRFVVADAFERGVSSATASSYGMRIRATGARSCRSGFRKQVPQWSCQPSHVGQLFSTVSPHTHDTLFLQAVPVPQLDVSAHVRVV